MEKYSLQDSHDLLGTNLSSLLFNITTTEKEGPDIKYDIHEVKDSALDVITANYIGTRYNQITVHTEHLPILKGGQCRHNAVCPPSENGSGGNGGQVMFKSSL